MPVTSADLLVAANQRAAALNTRPLTARMVRGLVDGHVLIGGTNKGVKRGDPWRYPDEMVSTIEGVVEFRSQGARRNTQLKLSLWQFGHQYSFEVLRGALKSEFARFRKRQDRQPPWWDFDYRDRHRLSERQVAKAKKRLSKLDRRLVIPDLTLHEDALLQICSMGYWGGDATSRSISETASGGLPLFDGMPEPLLAVLSIFLSIEGALGDPQETGLNLLARIIEDDLRFARDAIWLCYGGLVAMKFLMEFLAVPRNDPLVTALEAAIGSFLLPDWIVVSLALFSISHLNYRKNGQMNSPRIRL